MCLYTLLLVHHNSEYMTHDLYIGLDISNLISKQLREKISEMSYSLPTTLFMTVMTNGSRVNYNENGSSRDKRLVNLSMTTNYRLLDQ